MIFQTHYLFVQRHSHSLINTLGIFNKRPFFLMQLLTALKAGQVQVASFNWFIILSFFVAQVKDFVVVKTAHPGIQATCALTLQSVLTPHTASILCTIVSLQAFSKYM